MYVLYVRCRVHCRVGVYTYCTNVASKSVSNRSVGPRRDVIGSLDRLKQGHASVTQNTLQPIAALVKLKKEHIFFSISYFVFSFSCHLNWLKVSRSVTENTLQRRL